MSGSYLPDAEALVRLRVFDGKPAFEVLTPLRTDDGRLVLVDRGFVTAEAGGRRAGVRRRPPAGPVTLVGRLRVDENDPQHRPAVRGRRAPPALRRRLPADRRRDRAGAGARHGCS